MDTCLKGEEQEEEEEGREGEGKSEREDDDKEEEEEGNRDNGLWKSITTAESRDKEHSTSSKGEWVSQCAGIPWPDK